MPAVLVTESTVLQNSPFLPCFLETVAYLGVLGDHPHWDHKKSFGTGITFLNKMNLKSWFLPKSHIRGLFKDHIYDIQEVY